MTPEELETEQTVLSWMMWHPGKVQSLSGDEFLRQDHRDLYLSMRSGVPFDDLMRVADPYYVQDLYYRPAVTLDYLKDAIADLKRWHQLRPLLAAVDAWRVRAPLVTYEVALKQLGAVLRGGR